MAKRILLVDDDVSTTQALRRLLELHHFEVREENDPVNAVSTAKAFQPDCVILDYLMPLMHGGDVAWQLASDPALKSINVIVCSGVSSDKIAHRLPPARIPILAKPVDSQELLQLLQIGSNPSM
jgi:chemosensory pili system protein ChpA (sensor histidine kinase/response regulator)